MLFFNTGNEVTLGNLLVRQIKRPFVKDPLQRPLLVRRNKRPLSLINRLDHLPLNVGARKRLQLQSV